MTRESQHNGETPPDDAPAQDEDELETISLVDEEGVESEFFVHDVVELEGTRFFVLEAVEDEEEVLILKMQDDLLVSPEEDELEKVIQLLEEDWEEEGES